MSQKSSKWSAIGLINYINASPINRQYVENSYFTGASINSSTLLPGQIFFALKGTKTHGQEYIVSAVNNGASLVVTDKHNKALPSSIKDKILLVQSPEGALWDAAKFLRNQSKAYYIGITGSCGKTSTKFMLYLALKNQAKVSVSEKSFNNHLGVPLSILNTVKDCEISIIELGMSNKGEIAKLSKLVKPDLSIITNVGPAHIENFNSLEEIAFAKCEIYEGMKKGSNIILNFDHNFIDIFISQAQEYKLNILGYSGTNNLLKNNEAKKFLAAKIEKLSIKDNAVTFLSDIQNTKTSCKINTPATHMANNALASLLATKVLNKDIALAAINLQDYKSQASREKVIELPFKKSYITIIDSTYNANYISVKAAIEMLKNYDISKVISRKILVLGEILHMGKYSSYYLKKISKYILLKKPDKIYLCGEQNKIILKDIRDKLDTVYADQKSEICSKIENDLQPKDVILIKASNASNMYDVVKYLKHRLKN